MTGQDAERSQLSRFLRQIQRLAEQVRVTADRVQAETEPAARCRCQKWGRAPERAKKCQKRHFGACAWPTNPEPINTGL